MISGLRRSGKSMLLSMLCDQQPNLDIEGNQIHTYNFELPENYLNISYLSPTLIFCYIASCKREYFHSL